MTEDKPAVATALSWDEATRTHTKPVTYEARNKREAQNWCNFNKCWMTSFRIDGKPYYPF